MATKRALSLFESEESDDAHIARLGQFMTKRWAAQELFDANFPGVGRGDVVADLAAGTGSWLAAVPAEADAFGVEIDPELAARASADTGRRVIVGDFRTVEIDDEPSILLGNPPFASEHIAAFLRRTAELLAPGGRAGYILPVHSLGFARPTLELLRGFEVRVQLVPRDLYPRLSFPLLFAHLTRTPTQRLIGFALYSEAAALRSMRVQYRRVIESGRRPIWRTVVEMALQALGGEGTLAEIYEVVEDFRPTANRFWRDKIRQEAGANFLRVAEGRFRLAPTATRMASAPLF